MDFICNSLEISDLSVRLLVVALSVKCIKRFVVCLRSRNEIVLSISFDRKKVLMLEMCFFQPLHFFLIEILSVLRIRVMQISHYNKSSIAR